MCTTTAVTTIGPAHCRKFVAHEVLAAGATMAAPAEYSNLVNKVVFLHDGLLFATNCKYTMSVTSNTIR